MRKIMRSFAKAAPATIFATELPITEQYGAEFQVPESADFP
jgi:hypothetical protein